jgi:hypothetical protein
MMCFCFFNKTPKTKVQLGGLLHSFLFSLLLQYCSMTSDGLDMMLCDVMTDRPTDMLNVLACAFACCLNRLLEILHHYNRASTVCNISSIYNSIYNIFNLLVSSQATKKERKEQLKRHFNHLFISINTASIDWLTPFELSTYKFQIHFHCNNHVTVHLYNHSHQNRNHVLKIMLASFCISDGCFHHCSSLYYYHKKYCSPSRHRLP